MSEPTYYLKSQCNTAFCKIEGNKKTTIDLDTNFATIKESMFTVEQLDSYTVDEFAFFMSKMEICQPSDSIAFSLMDRLEKLFTLAKVHTDERNEQPL